MFLWSTFLAEDAGDATWHCAYVQDVVFGSNGSLTLILPVWKREKDQWQNRSRKCFLSHTSSQCARAVGTTCGQAFPENAHMLLHPPVFDVAADSVVSVFSCFA